MTATSARDERSARLPRDSLASAALPVDDHLVQFYEKDDYLRDVVVTFLAVGLAAGEPAIIIATEAHRHAFLAGLAATGVDVDACRRTGRLTLLDAGDTLAELMVGEGLDADRFRRVIGGLLAERRRAAASSTVRTYGEMVDFLWRAGRRDAALRLEELWNDLQRDQPFKLLCSYPMDGFYREASGLHDVCKAHGTVLPFGPRIAPADRPHRAPLENVVHGSFGELRRAEEELREHRRELQDFLDNAPLGVHRIGPDGVILWANRAELEILGYAVDDYIGHNITEFHLDAGTAREFLQRLGAGEALRDFPATLRGRDGTPRQVVISSNVRWQDGKFGYAQSFTRDVTELKRNERENQQARERAELLYRLVGGVVDATTIDDVFAAALGGIETALQAPRSSILVFDRQGVMRFRAWRGLSDGYRRSAEGHSPWLPDAQNPSAIIVTNVETHPAMASYLPLFRAEGIGALAFIPLVAAGRLIGQFMVYYDGPRALSLHELGLGVAIANHTAAAIARFSAVLELEQAVRFNEMFTAILGHDLRNPLAGIMATAEMAVRRPEGERFLEPLGRIVASGRRMARMIDQLLDFTRARLGTGIPLVTKHIDLLPLARQVLDELAIAHPDWKFRLDRAGDTQGIWDDDRLCQIVSNLVGNAVQHGIAEHGVNVHIDGTSPDAVHLRVRNMGTIPEELMARIFDPMTGGERRREKSHGLGLGLFISQQIAKAHGGYVDVASTEGEGTTFRVLLPRVALHGAKAG
jgi:PAS domain S-box-containing protein